VAAAGGRRVVESLPSEELLAKLLEVPPRTPLLFVESVTWNESGQSFDCYQTWLRTDRMKIEIEVVAGPPAHQRPTRASLEGSLLSAQRP
jgi:hypothetical protein